MGSVHWTREEIEILKSFWRDKSHEELSDLLPGRSIRAVRTKCSRMGLVDRDHEWSVNDIAYLRSRYFQVGEGNPIDLKTLEERLGRSASNICRKARQLGLGTQYGRSRSPEEKERMSRRQKQWWVDHEDARQLQSERFKVWHQKHEHPKGALGYKHSAEMRRQASLRSKKMWSDPEAYVNSEEYRQILSDRARRVGLGTRPGHHAYSRVKGGYREDLDQFFRSAWEANYARYLNFLEEQNQIQEWDYESETFEFEKIKRGTRSYTPDFRIVNCDGSVEFHEVKGWMDQKSKTRLKRMAKYFPDVKLVLIDKSVYREIEKKLGKLILNWE